MLHLECSNYGLTLKPENIDQFNRSISGVVELPGKLSSQIWNILKDNSIVLSIPVIPGYPDIEAQLRAHLKQ